MPSKRSIRLPPRVGGRCLPTGRAGARERCGAWPACCWPRCRSPAPSWRRPTRRPATSRSPGSRCRSSRCWARTPAVPRRRRWCAPSTGTSDVLDKDVGVDVDADWNRADSQRPSTRAYLVALWDDPTPQIARIQATARTHLITWSAIGFAVGLVAASPRCWGLASRRRLASYSPEQADLVRRHNKVLRRSLVVSAWRACSRSTSRP